VTGEPNWDHPPTIAAAEVEIVLSADEQEVPKASHRNPLPEQTDDD
jgi:hypothetical protein